MNVFPHNASVGSRRRGCNCKKSSCLKLYCECFAASGRCSKRCQCEGCKNHDHNQERTTQATQVTEKRTQKTSCPSLQASKTSEPEPVAEPSKQTPPSSMDSIDTAVTFLPQKKAGVTMAITSPRPSCACADGNCIARCPCLSLNGVCSPHCQCNGCLLVQIQPERTKGCSCKKSNCLKLYCECLAAQRMCDHRCSCEGCKNRPETLPERERAVAAILERNPLAFQPKIATGSSQHLRGCNCRKSGCMKNYCECHQAGVACTSRCACHQCRNTETFVSAKKMLVFAGVSTDDSSLRATLNHSLQRKIVKRPSRGGTNNADTQDELETPTHSSNNKSTALELLSRSATGAPFKLCRRKVSETDDVPPMTPHKRPSSNSYCRTDECVVTPAFSKRKYTRRNPRKIPFMERIQQATALVNELPNVEDTVTNVYDARNTEGVGDPELTILSRSLLRTAVAVELANEEKKVSTSPSVGQSPVKQQAEHSFEAKPQGAFDLSDGREALSPTAAGLFCEEEYSEAVAEDDDHLVVATLAFNQNGTASRPTTIDHESNPRSRQNVGNASLSAMQERAVLQELSVWLRNMTANIPSY